MKRSELKSLVKECLLEIISESFITSAVNRALNESLSSASEPQTLTETAAVPSRQSQQKVANDFEKEMMRQKLRELVAPDTLNKPTHKISVVKESVEKPAELTDAERMQKFKETLAKVKGLASQQQQIRQPTTQDNVMSSIVADTMNTTLKYQHETKQVGELHPDDPGIDISKMFNPNWKTIAGV